MSTYRDHPGICEPAPPDSTTLSCMLAYGEAGWPEVRDLMTERIGYERRHAAEIERREYARRFPVKVPI